MPMFAVSQLKTHVDAKGGKPAKGEDSAQGPVDEKPSPNEEAEMEVDC
jgi:hypothetical protein